MFRRSESQPQNVWSERAEIFKESYSEVLAATKHQDDKLARSLTAIAFLTAAGVATFNAVRDTAPVLFDGQKLSAQAFFFIVFLVAVVLAVGASLAAIGPTSHYGEVGGETWKSLLFYALIARDKRWHKYIKEHPTALRQTLAENFHKEAKLIANRIPYKMARAREAAAFINVAAMSLALLGIFSIEKITPETRWWIAAGVLFSFSLIPLFDFFQMRTFGFTERDDLPGHYGLLLMCCVASAFLLALGPEHDVQWPAVGYSLGLILTSRLALLSKKYARWLLPASAVAGGVIIAVLVFNRL